MTTNLKQRIDAATKVYNGDFDDTDAFQSGLRIGYCDLFPIITDLMAINKQLAEALGWYSDPVNRRPRKMPQTCAGWEVWGDPILMDNGTLAAQAIKSYHQHGFGE